MNTLGTARRTGVRSAWANGHAGRPVCGILGARAGRGRTNSATARGSVPAVATEPDETGPSSQPRPSRGNITRLIEDAGSGGVQAQERLLGEVYRELRVIAAAYMRHERPGHTLGATGLVNESYLKIFGGDNGTIGISFAHRHAFFKAASVAMRRILIDHARARRASKRSPGGGRRVISADVEIASHDADPRDLLALDEALGALEAEDDRAAMVVQLRFFAGRQMGEIAEMLGVSERTVKRDWEFARARLQQLLDDNASKGGA